MTLRRFRFFLEVTLRLAPNLLYTLLSTSTVSVLGLPIRLTFIRTISCLLSLLFNLYCSYRRPLKRKDACMNVHPFLFVIFMQKKTRLFYVNFRHVVKTFRVKYLLFLCRPFLLLLHLAFKVLSYSF